MKARSLMLISLFILIAQTGCLYAVRYDGPYHGKVVDQETREPIEGVVVLGSWWVYHYDVGGGHSTYHDAREVVTDKNGEFTIKGEGLRVLSSLQPMSFIIYKSGYTYFEGRWDTLKTGAYPKRVVEWEGETPVMPIRKLADEERAQDLDSNYIPLERDVPSVIMRREINKELKFRGRLSLQSEEL